MKKIFAATFLGIFLLRSPAFAAGVKFNKTVVQGKNLTVKYETAFSGCVGLFDDDNLMVYACDSGEKFRFRVPAGTEAGSYKLAQFQYKTGNKVEQRVPIGTVEVKAPKEKKEKEGDASNEPKEKKAVRFNKTVKQGKNLTVNYETPFSGCVGLFNGADLMVYACGGEDQYRFRVPAGLEPDSYKLAQFQYKTANKVTEKVPLGSVEVKASE